MSDAALRACLERIGSDAPVRFDEVTRSTQVTALELAADGAPEWTLVAAGHQTEGRGRLGRSWEDAPGALLFSVVLRPVLAAPDAGLLSLLAGASMASALRGAGVRVACKWPNDLLVDDAKVGGILSGSALRGDVVDHVVLGVGVNLGAAPDVPGAGAVGRADAAEILGAFLESFAGDYRSDDLGAAVLDRYRRSCSTLGRRVRATTVDGETIEGVAEDVDERGGLLVRSDVGERTVRFGAVEHLGPLPGSGTAQ